MITRCMTSLISKRGPSPLFQKNDGPVPTLKLDPPRPAVQHLYHRCCVQKASPHRSSEGARSTRLFFAAPEMLSTPAPVVYSVAMGVLRSWRSVGWLRARSGIPCKKRRFSIDYSWKSMIFAMKIIIWQPSAAGVSIEPDAGGDDGEGPLYTLLLFNS